MALSDRDRDLLLQTFLTEAGEHLRTLEEALVALEARPADAELLNGIFRVAHNYGLKVRERQILEEPFDPALETRLEAASGHAEHQMIENERMQRFHNAVQGLSEQQKRCLFLRMEGLRYPEIGSTLGISPSAVGEFLRRAMARLKKVRDE